MVKPQHNDPDAARESDALDPGQDADLEPVVVAVDVARFGSDKSVILLRRGMTVEEIQTYRGLDTMKLVGRVVDAINTWHPQEVVVDEIGIGAGVVDRLREQGYRVQGVNVGRPARDNELHANLRAEGYWNLRQLLQDGLTGIPRTTI